MPYDLSGISVAILDANVFSRRLLRSLLAAIGVPGSNITDMTDVETALEALVHLAPDMMLCEISLPGGDGFSFIQAVRQMEDEAKRYMPIIVCTAHTDERRVLACRDAGAHEVLHKPISVTTLYQRIVSVIEHPRSFVYAPVFAGPDRRRRVVADASLARRSDDSMS